jgi:hypothetical protein
MNTKREVPLNWSREAGKVMVSKYIYLQQGCDRTPFSASEKGFFDGCPYPLPPPAAGVFV